ncbi:GPW/gp25 family protein [Kribbella sp. NBC_00889]|uniref:GPW/gp25 family protein n=1 Tax=Kribbella sp. NBC_00889 TaxID=2975974 RepID=UPI0038641B36|nr:GPW/gp25 family protein [Kribbella sp. NBC_00889]
MSDEVLGRGLSFPLRISGTGLAESAGVARVEQSIRIILGTQYGERVMRPGFGANLKSLVFAPNNATTASLAGYYVTDALTRWEPRIDVLDVQVINDVDGAQLVIEIRYRLRATAQEHLLVLPFLLERG